jgi:hypothetical protein
MAAEEQERAMIQEKVSKRWEFAVHENERGSATLVVVNSVDDDPKLAKITVAHSAVIVQVVDLVELLRRIETHVGLKTL